MLIPMQTSGDKPPLFLIHGNNGVMPFAGYMSRVFGPDQPVYAIHANGFDGGPPFETAEEMVQDYLSDIVAAAPEGPLIIGAQCWGTMVALEIGSRLSAMGRMVGPLILMDPPRVPYGQGAGGVDEAMSQKLYRYVQGLLLKLAAVPYYEVPFDAQDPDELHIATLAGVGSVTAMSRFAPKPYLGAVSLILSADTAPPFFGPAGHWKGVLPNPPYVHVVPCGHVELWGSHRHEVARLVNFLLSEAFPQARQPSQSRQSRVKEQSAAD